MSVTRSTPPTEPTSSGDNPFAQTRRRYIGAAARKAGRSSEESAGVDGWENRDSSVGDAGGEFGPYALPGVTPEAPKPTDDGKAPGEFMVRGRRRRGRRSEERGGFDFKQPPPEAPSSVRNVEVETEDAGRPVRTPEVADGGELPVEMTEVAAWLEQFSDEELDRIAAGISFLRHERALRSGDLEARVAEAQRTCFNSRDRLGTMPWCEGNVLWAPGSRQDISTTRHRCRFVRVNGRWVWEWGDVLADDIRRQGDGRKLRQTSITVAVVDEGCEVDVVTATSTNGRHTTQRVDSFVVVGGELERVGSRTVGEVDHR